MMSGADGRATSECYYCEEEIALLFEQSGKSTVTWADEDTDVSPPEQTGLSS